MPDPQEGKPDASSALPRGSEEPDGAPSLNESDKYAADRRLPVVVAPRLDGGDAVMPPAVEAFVEMSRAGSCWQPGWAHSSDRGLLPDGRNFGSRRRQNTRRRVK